jgi:hypothetical protein
MKIAVCLYGKFSGENDRGNIRGFEKSFEFLKKNILSDNTDIFIHGWDDNQGDTQKILELYKPKKFILEKQIQFDHPYKHYNFIPEGPWATKNYINNDYSRFFSIKKVVELIEGDYDLVLIARFDTVFFQNFPWEQMDCKNFYVSHWGHNKHKMGFQDAWFISGLDLMKKWTQIYDRLDDYFSLDSDYFKFIKNHGGDETNLPSGHAISRYRTIELGLEDVTFCVGALPETWTLERYLDREVREINPELGIQKLK